MKKNRYQNFWHQLISKGICVEIEQNILLICSELHSLAYELQRGKTMTRLCFGTFAQVLRLCKLENVTDRKLVGTLTRTVDPTCQYIHKDNASAVTRLFNCEGNLSPGRLVGDGSGAIKKPGEPISDVINASQKADKDEVVQKFLENVIPLLDEDKKELIVLTLLDIIERDDVLDDDKKLSFEKYIGQTKNALLSQGDFALDEFLAGIFLYTVAAGVKNTVGKQGVKELTPDYINGLKSTREINVVDHANIESEVFSSRTVVGETNIELSNNEIDKVQDFLFGSRGETPSEIEFDFKEYLGNVKDRYSKLKTLLYDKTPKEFYSFYVCNDLKHDEKIIDNVTVDKLSSYSHYSIITGIGGLGKSMMMRHLLLNAIDNFDTLKLFPVFIPLKDYGETGENLFDYVLSVVQQFDESITREQFTDVLKNGSGLLLFDGLDEVKTVVFSRFVQEVERFTNAYSQNYFVISSRPSTKLVSLNKFYELELQPFNKPQALEMIDSFEFSIEESKIKENFRTRLDMELWWSHREFAENPLLLTIMLMTFEEYAEVPSKIHKFYEMAFETLAKKHDDTKLLDREFRSGLSKDKIAHYFAKICFLSYKDEKIELTESEFKNYLDRCLRNSLEDIVATDLLHDLSSNLCLLLQEGEKYHFVHRSFQEYFCAINFKSGFEKVSTDRKETMSTGLISFFEHSRDSQSESVLEMLYDMVPEKVHEYIIIPKLEQILGDDDLRDNEGYWNVLERAFPNLRCWYEYHECIEYDSETDEEIDESYYDFALGIDGRVESKVMQFILLNLLKLNEEDGFDDTYYDNEDIMEKVPLIVEEIEKVIKEEMDTCKIIDNPESDYVVIEYSAFIELIKSHEFEAYKYHKNSGEHEFWLLLHVIRKNNESHTALRSVIENKDFHLGRVCSAIQKYLSDLKAKQKVIDEEWAADFI